MLSLPLRALSVALALALLASSAVAAHDHDHDHDAHSTCTHGRLFVSDANAALIHVLDLDTHPPSVRWTLPSAAPAMSLSSTGSASDRVLALTGGNPTANVSGRVQVFRSGLTTDNHGDHFDVITELPPAKYTFEFEGDKPAHVTASAGYISVFFDGHYGTGQSDVDNRPAGAQFVSESAFTEDALDVDPALITIELSGKGAHHGVAYALGSDAFLLTEASEARATWTSSSSTPNGMKVYSASGTVIHDLNVPSDDSKHCNSSHGSAHVGDNTYLFGCRDGGLLRVQYSPSSGVSSSLLAYPVPVAGREYRSSTLYAQRAGAGAGDELALANFVDASGSPVVPSYLLAVPNAGSEAPTLSLERALRTDTGTARFCSFGVDQGASPVSGAALVAALLPDGVLRVSAVNTSSGAALATEHLALLASPIQCADYVLVPGFGKMHVLDKVAQQLHTVYLAAVIAQEEREHTVSSVPLGFTPARGVVSMPNVPGAACEAEGDHDDGGEAPHMHASFGTIAALAAVAVAMANTRML